MVKNETVPEEGMPEPNTELEKVTPGDNPEPEPEAPPPPTHEGKVVSDIVAGETFHMGGEKYRLRQMVGETAQVMLLKERKDHVGPSSYVTHEVGVEIHDIPGDTEIE